MTNKNRLYHISRPYRVIIAIIAVWSFLFCSTVHAMNFDADSQKLRPLAAEERQRYILGADPVSVRYRRPFTIVLSVDKNDPPEDMEVKGNVRLQIMHYRDIPNCFLLKERIDRLIKSRSGSITADDYFIVDIDNIAYSRMFKTLRDGEKVIIGRASPHRFNLPGTISRDHVEITRDGDRIIIKDLGSRNGTTKPMFSKAMPGAVKENAQQIDSYARIAPDPRVISGIMDRRGRIVAFGDQRETVGWLAALRGGRVFAFVAARSETKNGDAVQYILAAITESHERKFPLKALQTLAASLDEASRIAFVPQEVSPERDRAIAAVTMGQVHEIMASGVTADNVERAVALISELGRQIPALDDIAISIGHIFENADNGGITRAKALQDIAGLLSRNTQFIRRLLAAAEADLPSVGNGIGQTVVDFAKHGIGAKEILSSILRPLAAGEKRARQIPAAMLGWIIEIMRSESAEINSFIAKKINDLPKSTKKQRLPKAVMNRYRAMFEKIAAIGRGLPEFDSLAKAIKFGDFSHVAVMNNLAGIFIDSGMCLVFGERPDYIKERYIDNLPELSLSRVTERRTIDLDLIGNEEKIAAIGLEEAIVSPYSELEGMGTSGYKAACIPAVRINGAVLVVYKRLEIIGELLDYYTTRAYLADKGDLPENAKTHNEVVDEALKALLIKQWPNLPSMSQDQFASDEEYALALKARTTQFFRENYESYLGSIMVHEIFHTLLGPTLDERIPTLAEMALTDYGWLRLYGLMRLLAGENDEGKSLVHVRALNFILLEVLPSMFEKIEPELIPDIPEAMRIAAAKVDPHEYPDELFQAIQRLPVNVFRGVALVALRHLAGIPAAQPSAGSTPKPRDESEILAAV